MGITHATASTTSDPTNCPLTMKLEQELSPGVYAPFTGTCIELDVSNNVVFKGVDFCKDTNVAIKVTAPGGALKYTTPFTVEVKVDCSAHLKVPVMEDFYAQTLPDALVIQGVPLTFKSGSITTTDATNCPIDDVEIWQETSPGIFSVYTGPCVTDV